MAQVDAGLPYLVVELRFATQADAGHAAHPAAQTELTLAVVRYIAQRHGGRLEVESRGAGTGVLRLVLPAVVP